MIYKQAVQNVLNRARLLTTKAIMPTRISKQQHGNYSGEITDPDDPTLHIVLIDGREQRRYYLKSYDTGDARIVIKQAGKHPGPADTVFTSDMQAIADGEYTFLQNEEGMQKIKVGDGKIEDVTYHEEIEAKTILIFLLVLIVLSVVIVMISRSK
jgi:hypothetical protein